MWHTFKIYNYYLFNLLLVALGLCCYMRAFCSCGKWRLLSTFSLRWRLLLQSMGCRARGLQYLWCMGLAALWNGGSSCTRAWTHVSCIGTQILNHWNHQASPCGKYFNSLNCGKSLNFNVYLDIGKCEKSFRFKFGK